MADDCPITLSWRRDALDRLIPPWRDLHFRDVVGRRINDVVDGHTIVRCVHHPRREGAFDFACSCGWRAVDPCDSNEPAWAHLVEALGLEFDDSVPPREPTQLERMRAALEEMGEEHWPGALDVDGESFQSILIKHGLLVEVPATIEFMREWDCDTMLVWAWSERARNEVS